MRTRFPTAFLMEPGAIALALFLKYLGLLGYGIHAAIAEVPTFALVGGALFAFVWACLVAGFGLLGLIGVGVSWRTGRVSFERRATGALILTFLVYSVVLIIRGVMTGSGGAASLAWLPAVLTFFPLVRYYTLGGRP